METKKATLSLTIEYVRHHGEPMSESEDLAAALDLVISPNYGTINNGIQLLGVQIDNN